MLPSPTTVKFLTNAPLVIPYDRLTTWKVYGPAASSVKVCKVSSVVTTLRSSSLDAEVAVTLYPKIGGVAVSVQETSTVINSVCVTFRSEGGSGRPVCEFFFSQVTMAMPCCYVVAMHYIHMLSRYYADTVGIPWIQTCQLLISELHDWKVYAMCDVHTKPYTLPANCPNWIEISSTSRICPWHLWV